MSDKKTALVISAHSADFVWRAGGAIALHQAKGYEVTVVCLSYGERGESAKLWKQEGMTLEKVKIKRRKEAENAAVALGINDIRFFDVGDYPLDLGRKTQDRMVDVIREVQPKFMMSHSKWDPYNTDHMHTTQFALQCRMIAQAWGHNPGEKVLGAPQLYLFEPHQSEQMEWKPTTFLNITDVWDKKWAGASTRTWLKTAPTTSAAIQVGKQAVSPPNTPKGSRPCFPVLWMSCNELPARYHGHCRPEY